MERVFRIVALAAQVMLGGGELSVCTVCYSDGCRRITNLA